MNFIGAIKHAAIGYGIRRKAWAQEAILHIPDNYGGHELVWMNRSIARCQILGPDLSFDLQDEDITATDWETV